MTHSQIPLLLLFAALTATPPAYAQRRPVVQRPIDPGLPRISGEFPVADVSYGPTYTRNVQPAVAAGPDQSLVVWSGPSYTEAARVDGSGRVLDVTPLVLPGQPSYPSAVIWDGRHYLVVTASWSESGWIVRLVGVSTDGRIDSTAELGRVPEQVVDLSIVRQASGELGIACATLRPDGNRDLSLFIAGSDGRIMPPLSIATMSAADGGATVRLAASPTAYLAVWSGGAALIGNHGATLKLLPLPPYTTSDATWNGTDFTIVTADATAVRMFHLLGNGEITPSTIVHPSPNRAWFPALAWNGAEYRVLWKESATKAAPYSYPSYDLHTARVAPGGEVLDDRVLSISTDLTNRYSRFIDRPAVVAQEDGWLLAWTRLSSQDFIAPGGDAYALKVQADEQPSIDDVTARQQLLSRSASYETAPALTLTPGAARVIWREGGQSRTAAIDPAGHRSADSSAPAGAYLLVAGSDSGTVIISRELNPPYRLMGALIGHEGIAGTQFPIVAPPSDASVSPMALACGTNDCAVAYSTIVGSATDTTRYHFQRFTPAGTLIAQPVDIPIGLLGLNARGDEYLLAFWWPTKEFVVSRFAGGKLSNVTRLASDVSNPFRTAVASNTTGWFVAWMDYRIRAFRVDGDGSLQGETDLVFPSGTVIDNASATWDGRDWLVAWSQTGLLSDVYAARVAPDGTLLDFRNGSPGFGVAATVNGEYTPVIGSAGGGLTAVAYARATTEQKYGETSRVFVRWIDNR